MAPPRHAQPFFSGSWCSPGWAGGVIAVAALAAYAGSFGGPFVFDDLTAIARNPTIRHFSSAFSPPLQSTVGGRPLVNLSLALNYAISGTQVWSYHALNLLIHILAGLTLFGVVRRTLEQVGTGGPPIRAAAEAKADTDGRAARPYLIGFVVALLWTLHPLQTESVTYVIQRAESLMGLLYLLTLYCFIRGVGAEGKGGQTSAAKASEGEEASGKGWFLLSIGCCLLGMAAKEVMVTAPLMVLLYDRAFVTGSFGGAWRLRRRLYLALAATWLLLGWLVWGTGGRGGTAGFGTAVPWWAYALTQFRAIAHYLRLSFWPHPLVADYGRILGGSPAAVALDAVVVGLLVAATLRGLWRRPTFGFIGVWFFLILAPSSSVVPVATEIIAEHRMYLPLAAVLVVAVLVLDAVLSRIPWLVVCALGAIGLGVLTARRNEVYQSSVALWGDTVAKMPANAGARNNFGNLLFQQGRVAEAMAQYREALRFVPEYADAHYNLGLALAKTGQLPEAIENYQAALRFRTEDEHIHNSLGLAWLQEGRLEEAREQFEEALRLAPGLADARVNHGNVLVRLGREKEAIGDYAEALRLEPGAADVHNNLGVLLVRSGRPAEADEQFQEALRLLPDYREARDNLERLQALERARSGR
jgi:tetratricopeptide (TPR) repeat protein